MPNLKFSARKPTVVKRKKRIKGLAWRKDWAPLNQDPARQPAHAWKYICSRNL